MGGVPDQVHPPRDQVHPPWDQVHPPGAEHAGRYGQGTGGTHPTGMHSLFKERSHITKFGPILPPIISDHYWTEFVTDQFVLKFYSLIRVNTPLIHIKFTFSLNIEFDY